MSKQKVDFDELERLGKKAFGLCDRYAYDTLRTCIDIDRQTEHALVAILRGEPLEDALSHIDERHPAAELVKAELTAAYSAHAGAAA